MPDVRNAKQDNGVPAHHAEIKQVGDPHELSHPKNDKNSDYLSEQDTASTTEGCCRASHQRIGFENRQNEMRLASLPSQALAAR